MIIINRIYLLGFMGTGKTAVAQILADKLGWKLYDTDKTIVEKHGTTISDIFKTDGEDFFRDLESSTLKELSAKENAVISCGGGIVLSDENIEVMNSTGRTILLSASPLTIFTRLKNDDTRPLLAGNVSTDYIAHMLQERKKQYDKSSKLVINTDHCSLEDIADEIINSMEEVE